MEKPKRMAFVLITFPRGSRGFLDVISTISKFESLLLGSLQIPDPESEDSVFGLVVRANTDELGALAGSLGRISGVKVKSAVLPMDEKNDSKSQT